MVCFKQCDAIDPADVAKIVVGVTRALAIYGTLAFKEMIRNCMSQELSWKVWFSTLKTHIDLDRMEWVDQMELIFVFFNLQNPNEQLLHYCSSNF